MNNKKYKFQLLEVSTILRIGMPAHVDDFDEFINLLREKGIKKVSFRFYSMLDDIPEWWEHGVNMAIDDIQPLHFEWLTTKDYGQSKYLQIDEQYKKSKIP
jgi:hypothetical protein